MQITQTQSLRMEQKLIMTPQMIQSIEMLQLPLMDLEQNIAQELNSNPWLEPVEGDQAAAPTPKDDEAEARRKAQSEIENDPRVKRAEALMDDWNDSNTRPPGGGRYAGEDDAKMEAMQNTAAHNTTLEDHLLGQLHLSKEDPHLKELAEVIIGSLDENGYLKAPLMDIFYRTEGEIRQPLVAEGITEEDAELALSLVQGFEPPGVGARDLKECLLLQLRRSSGDTAFEEKLVQFHLDDISHNRLPKIAKDLGVTMERVKEALGHIQHLNPKPGRGFGGARPQYVVPDVIVEEIGGEFIIRVNEHFLPSLRLSRDALSLLRSPQKDPQVREYVMQKLGSAIWLMESVIQRRHTLFRIAQQIVEIQKPFFRNGPANLKPLMMQEVAERINIHVSTVSRALAGKYMQTPQGLFPMKYFFTGGFSTSGGEFESNRAIMLRIQEMVNAEPKDKPLSDDEIAKRLETQHVKIARRTIAKYREKLNIASSRQRKAY